ncbi:ABC transporter permease [Streptomyces sp. NPDC001889]
MRAMTLRYVRLEVRRALRDTGFAVFGVGLPVLMYLLFSAVGTAAESWATPRMVGMGAYAAVAAALATGIGVAEDTSTGWLRQLRTTPMTSRQLVTGRAITGSVAVLPPVVAVLVTGGLVNGVRLDAWQWAAITLLLWLGALPFTLLGIGNGYWLSVRTTGLVNAASAAGLAVLGGLWFPATRLPCPLEWLAGYTPAGGFTALGRAVADGVPPGPMTVPVLGFWAVLCTGYAAISYRRSAKDGVRWRVDRYGPSAGGPGGRREAAMNWGRPAASPCCPGCCSERERSSTSSRARLPGPGSAPSGC